jgi:hypothetical protein
VAHTAGASFLAEPAFFLSRIADHSGSACVHRAPLDLQVLRCLTKGLRLFRSLLRVRGTFADTAWLSPSLPRKTKGPRGAQPGPVPPPQTRFAMRYSRYDPAQTYTNVTAPFLIPRQLPKTDFNPEQTLPSRYKALIFVRKP